MNLTAGWYPTSTPFFASKPADAAFGFSPFFTRSWLQAWANQRSFSGMDCDKQLTTTAKPSWFFSKIPVQISSTRLQNGYIAVYLFNTMFNGIWSINPLADGKVHVSSETSCRLIDLADKADLFDAMLHSIHYQNLLTLALYPDCHHSGHGLEFIMPILAARLNMADKRNNPLLGLA